MNVDGMMEYVCEAWAMIDNRYDGIIADVHTILSFVADVHTILSFCC